MAEAVPNAVNPVQNGKPEPKSNPIPSLPSKFDFPDYLPTPPFVDVDGVPNFRDMGGYLTAMSYFSAGNTSNTKPIAVRKGFLYRCAQPNLITETGKNTLTNRLNIRHVYDLRSLPEVKKIEATYGPDALKIDGATRHFVPVYEDQDYSPVALGERMKWYTGAPESHASKSAGGIYSEGFVNAYRDISIHGAVSGGYVKIFRHILEKPDQPLVFHCTAGKDRTGVIGAMIYRLAGVDDETIAWEYALTEPGLGSWRELFIRRIIYTGIGGAGVSDKAKTEGSGKDAGPQPVLTWDEAARIVGSRAGNMRAYLRIVLDGEFGGVEKYLIEKCGFTKEEVAKIRGNVVAPVENIQDVVMPKSIAGWDPYEGMRKQHNEMSEVAGR